MRVALYYFFVFSFLQEAITQKFCIVTFFNYLIVTKEIFQLQQVSLLCIFKQAA